MKVSELEGAALDYWIAKAEGATRVHIATDEKGDFAVAEFTIDSGTKFTSPYFPSTQWSDGGPIIEREKIGTNTWHGDWGAMFTFPRKHPTEPRKDPSHHWMLGKTPLIAAMRTYVSSKFGEEVSEE